MALYETGTFENVLKERTYRLLDAGELGDEGELWKGTPTAFTIGALPVEWDCQGRIITDGIEATLFHVGDQRMVVATADQGTTRTRKEWEAWRKSTYLN